MKGTVALLGEGTQQPRVWSPVSIAHVKFEDVVILTPQSFVDVHRFFREDWNRLQMVEIRLHGLHFGSLPPAQVALAHCCGGAGL